MSIQFAIEAFVAIFAIVNPIGNIPFFVTLTQGYSPKEKKDVIMKVVIVAIAVLVIFGLIGNYIFMLFGITIPAFGIAGGILLLSIAFSMLHGQKPRTKLTQQDKEEALAREAVGIVPLGIPMFAGPGAITTIMIYMSRQTGVFDMFAVFASIFATMAVSFILLTYSDGIFSKMGRMGALAISRIMGLILAAIAIQFIIDGVLDVARLNGLI
jgi:multiple antibiotic resistance protein